MFEHGITIGGKPLKDHLEAIDHHEAIRYVRELRAGVTNYGSLTSYHEAVARNDPPWPRAYLLEAVGGDHLDFRPGAGWAYSNVGYLFVRDIIEDATGLSIAAALQKVAIAPLHLSSVRLAMTLRRRVSRDRSLIYYAPGYCMTSTGRLPRSVKKRRR